MKFHRFSRFASVLAIAGATVCSSGTAMAWVHRVCDWPGYGCPDSSSYGDGGEYLPPAPAIVNAPLTRVDNGYWPAFYWNRRGHGYREPVRYWNDGGFASEQNYGYDGPYEYGESVADGPMIFEGSAPPRRAVHRAAPPRIHPVRYQAAPAAIAAPGAPRRGFHGHDPLLGASPANPDGSKAPVDIPAPSWVTEGG